VNPLDPGSIAAAMLEIIENSSLGVRLEQAGRARSAGFTWANCARRHVDVYAAALGGGGIAPAVS
jgi:glycosyltransferase involved in cell wall biosynthesis